MMHTYKYTGTEQDVIVNAEPMPNPNVYQTEEYEEEEGKRCGGQAKGAAALCGLTGLLVGGPVLAILTAVGGAYTAAHNQGAIGDASRAVGDVAVAANDKARELKLAEKSRRAVGSAVHGARASFDRSGNHEAPHGDHY